jgi:hypothetical protein
VRCASLNHCLSLPHPLPPPPHPPPLPPLSLLVLFWSWSFLSPPCCCVPNVLLKCSQCVPVLVLSLSAFPPLSYGVQVYQQAGGGGVLIHSLHARFFFLAQIRLHTYGECLYFTISCPTALQPPPHTHTHTHVVCLCFMQNTGCLPLPSATRHAAPRQVPPFPILR